MNIFVLSEKPAEAAIMQCNKHVVKMLLESTQILCTNLSLLGHTVPYRPTHINHPCTAWARATLANTKWMLEHTWALNYEYSLRYKKIHKVNNILCDLTTLLSPAINADWHDHTPFVLAMPDECKMNNPIDSYRNYYITKKNHFAKWAPKSQAPSWWPFPE